MIGRQGNRGDSSAVGGDHGTADEAAGKVFRNFEERGEAFVRLAGKYFG